jgi:hypothetical protein
MKPRSTAHTNTSITLSTNLFVGLLTKIGRFKSWNSDRDSLKSEPVLCLTLLLHIIQMYMERRKKRPASRKQS